MDVLMDSLFVDRAGGLKIFVANTRMHIKPGFNWINRKDRELIAVTNNEIVEWKLKEDHIVEVDPKTAATIRSPPRNINVRLLLLDLPGSIEFRKAILTLNYPEDQKAHPAVNLLPSLWEHVDTETDLALLLRHNVRYNPKNPRSRIPGISP